MYLLSLLLFIVMMVFAAVDKIEDEFQIPFVGLLVVLSVLSYRD